jgi:hypothetical protein
MTGLLLLFVGALWLVLAFWLATLITRRLPAKWWRIPVGVLLSLALLSLLLIDEIVGMRQFAQLCRDNADVTVDAKSTRGRTVWFGGSQRVQIKLGMLRATQIRRSYVDAKTQEPIYHYYRLEAKGGALITLLGMSEGNTPLLFNGLCQPKNLETIDSRLGTTRINRPTFR